MKFNATQVQQIMQVLRNVAEVDPTDEIANAASQIAYELETVKLPLAFDDLNEKRQQVIRYAFSKRKQYIREPGARHAVDLQRVEKPRRTLPKRLTAQ
jgi:hypothetical protein